MAQAKAKLTIPELISTVEELAQNAVIVNSELPSAIIAERIVSEAEPELVSELGKYLVEQFALKLVRAERAKAAKERHAQMRLPGFEHVPVTILAGAKKKVALADATRRDLQRYLWRLNRESKEKAQSSARIAELKALIDRMERPASKNKGITVGEVLGLKE